VSKGRKPGHLHAAGRHLRLPADHQQPWHRDGPELVTHRARSPSHPDRSGSPQSG
jgi:hypothetical protein